MKITRRGGKGEEQGSVPAARLRLQFPVDGSPLPHIRETAARGALVALAMPGEIVDHAKN